MTWLNVCIGLCLCVLATAVRPTSRRLEPPDTLRIFSAFPRALIAYTTSSDTAFKCSNATRTLFDPEAKTVTYAWKLKGHNGHPARDIIIDLSFGETPGQATLFANQDTSRLYTAIYEYSDYSTCVVVKFPFHGQDHCSLWINEAVRHNVPKRCLKAYAKTCEHRVPITERNICKEEDE